MGEADPGVTPQSVSTQAGAGETSWPRPTYAWYVVGILTIAYTVSFIDRQIVALLVEPIRRDLQISDIQISLLQGFAFAIFYTVMGLPIARFADRHSRRAIIASGILFWSVMTAACGLAHNFWQLFGARVGVGVGEAALSPPAYSIIADYFPPDRLSRAISFYSMGIYIGAGLAFVIGGAVIHLVENSSVITLPLLGQVYPWQVTFLTVASPGLLVVALMATVKEPIRRGLLPKRTSKPSANAPPTVAQVVTFVGQNRYILSSHYLGHAFLALIGYANFAWIPTFMIRNHGWSAPQVGFVFGLLVLIFGTSGVVTGGWWADKLRARGRTDANMRVSMYAAIIMLPTLVAAPLVTSPVLAMALIAPGIFLLSVPFGIAPAALQVITPNQMRAQISALYLFVANIIGLGLGPTVVALITDYGFGDDLAVRYSLAITGGTVAPLAAISLALGLKHYRSSLKQSVDWT
jgi:MFS family permease